MYVSGLLAMRGLPILHRLEAEVSVSGVLVGLAGKVSMGERIKVNVKET